ncbi:MAG: hypothetical protein ACI9T9_000744 [Oleiphilaceae bacterium]|jgi:hypothetical protein
MNKTIGEFSLVVWNDQHPVEIIIKDAKGNEIKLNHHSISDLEHLVSEAKKACLNYLPDFYQCEV